MNEEDKEFQEFMDMFDKIPNPETYPKCFELCIKLYKYYKWRNNESRTLRNSIYHTGDHSHFGRRLWKLPDSVDDWRR